MRNFLFSTAFMGLVLLALNPFWVLAIQDKFDETFGYVPFISPDIIPRDPLVLPDTDDPDAENLPRLKNYSQIARNDTWIGTVPCGAEIFDAPENLPGVGARQSGPFLTEAIKARDRTEIINQPTHLYKSESGVTLKLVQPVIKYYDVSGRRYRDAQRDIFDRQPLKTLREAGAEYSPEIYDPRDRDGLARATVVADILSPTSLSYTVSGSRDRYQLVLDRTVLTSAFLVTLPRWKTYDIATAADKAKWDDFICNAAHHELGHLRIRLDILAETLDGYTDLPPAQSSEEMENLIIEFRTEISERVQKRQDAYHVYNGGGTRRGMTELPYVNLPFPWLEDPAPELPITQEN